VVESRANRIRSLLPPFPDSILRLEAIFQELALLVPAPVIEAFPRGGWVYRYKERSIQQAIILKLARYQSGLGACTTLLREGFLQDLGAIQRVLDELHEDICFLTYALIEDDVTDDHRRYLTWFFQEESSDGREGLIGKKRRTLPRRKIQAYLLRYETSAENRQRAALVSTTLSAVYSGFVHGAAPNILESYYGTPPVFHTSGQFGSPFFDDHDHDLWNQVFRGWLNVICSSAAFGDDEILEDARSGLSDFRQMTGREY